MCDTKICCSLKYGTPWPGTKQYRMTGHFACAILPPSPSPEIPFCPKKESWKCSWIIPTEQSCGSWKRGRIRGAAGGKFRTEGTDYLEIFHSFKLLRG